MKNIGILLSLGLIVWSCKPESKPVSKNQIEEQNIAIAKKVYEYFNLHDWEKMANLYSEVSEFKDPSLGLEIVKQTRSQIVQKYKEMHSMFNDIHDEVTAVYPSGEKHVVIEFVSSGTAPDGVKWKLPICTIFTIENNLITKDFTYYDNSQGK